MFGPFNGPLPEGKYNILISNVAMHVPIIINHTVVSMIALKERDDYQTWALEFGVKGYKIRNVASDNYLSCTRWGIPARMIGSYNHVIASAKSPVEWKLIQNSTGTATRSFQIRMISAPDLQPTDDFTLIWDGSGLYGTAISSGSTFIFRAVGSLENPPLPSSLTVANNTKCLIRSVYYPQITLELRPSYGHLVVGREITKEASQVWTFVKGGRGFKIKNSESGDNLGYAVVSNTPNGNQSMVCQDDRATEYTVVQSTEGYELRPTADPSLVVTIYNLDAGNNSWVFLEKGPSAGNGTTNQQWIFTKPE
ncbi:hypothetical protein FRB94_011621 [Tulasnella sp. JGI-2019a]|nr:hypothetical protein FRB93_002935 [Tulasnella sp. JGI-2019a]KAG8992404.1 hypothetical protein FRB94_011621 [Tulasnella sp. JGI-2019a]KAG9022875.1 hypothetical protein FRB95_014054 [Tulasnella sp. JGI-2019a]